MKFSLLDLFFPRFCSGCRRLGSFVCTDCRRHFNYLSYDVKIENVDHFSAVVAYAGVVAKIIKDSKYRLASAVLDEFLSVIESELERKVGWLKEAAPEILLQPVPLHPKRYRERGFNQSDIIAKKVSKLSGVKVVRCLRRAKHNLPQAQLPHEGSSRAENVRGIFEVIPGTAIQNRDFLLVDDVVTTGSTIGDAARALKQAGARRIFALSLAKG